MTCVFGNSVWCRVRSAFKMLDGLLGVEDDDVPKFGFRRKPDGGAEVEIRLLDPFGNQPANLFVRRPHREPCRICAPDRRSRR